MTAGKHQETPNALSIETTLEDQVRAQTLTQMLAATAKTNGMLRHAVTKLRNCTFQAALLQGSLKSLNDLAGPSRLAICSGR